MMNMKTKNVTTRDLFNVGGSIALQTVKTPITVTGAAIGEGSPDKEGVTHTVGYLFTKEGCYCTISSTAIRSIEDLIDIMDAEDMKEVVIAVNSRLSNSGREFITLSME